MSDVVLSLEQVHVRYRLDAQRHVEVVHDVSLEIEAGEFVGIVGESGSGKSTLGLAIPGLLPINGDMWSGEIQFQGRNVASMGRRELQDIRGPGLAMIFQDPMASLNPTYRIGTQLVDVQRAHLPPGRRPRIRDLRRRAIDMLAEVGIPEPDQRIDDYPYQFSGGMQQRVMIAMAALLRPAVVIADEPTSALDVTLQGQILELLENLRKNFGTSILIITHDLGVVSQTCNRLMVMYAGRLMESADVADMFETPLHPYTQALLKSMPSAARRGEPLEPIPGSPPRLTLLPPGCKFSDRCTHAEDVCRQEEPALMKVGRSEVRCFLYDRTSGHPSATSKGC